MDWQQGFDAKNDWLRAILFDELVAFTDFTNIPAQADGALGIGWFGDTVNTITQLPATDPRNGRILWTVPLSATSLIAVGPPGSTYGITSGQRKPSVTFRLTPVAANANLSSQRWGFVTVAAADTSGGIYVRSTTTGNLFFVARNETSGAETTYDMGVAPAVDTDYRIYTPDNGVSWLIEVNGVPLPVVMTTNAPAVTTRLQPQHRVIATAGGSVTFVTDQFFFRAWRETPPVTMPDRITAKELELRMKQQCLLLWYEGMAFTLGGPAGDTLIDGMGWLDTAGNFGTGYYPGGSAAVNICAAPCQNPCMVMRTTTAALGGLQAYGGAGQRYDQAVGFVSAWDSAQVNGAYFRMNSAGTPGLLTSLEFVTRQGGVETVTVVLGPTVSLAVAGHLEVRTIDGGISWQGLRNGVVVATHTTNCPTPATALAPALGRFTFASAAIDFVFAYCERLR